MKAKVSQLELNAYFVTGLGFTANPQFDPKKPSQLGFEDLGIEVFAYPPGTPENADTARWCVSLSIKQNVGPEKNSPYNFFIDLQGLFTVRGNILPEKIRGFMENTASAVLYGTAREILRGSFATGPYLPLILPAVVFVPDAPVAAVPAISAKSSATARVLPKPAPVKKPIARRTTTK